MDFTHLSSNLKRKTDFNAGEALGLRDINSITGVVDNSVTSLQALIFSNNVPEHDDLDPTKFDVTGITSGYDSKCFVFDIKKEYKYNLSSDITDHYVEDNVAIQDHIGLRPIILEVTGSIGEITLSEVIDKEKNSRKIAGEIGIGETQNNAKGNIFNSVDSYLGRMGSLTSFTPNIINQSLDIYNTAKFGYATVSKIINLDKQDKVKSGFDYTEDYNEETIKITKQFNYIDWFKIQWQNRASFTIVTPYGVLTDMYIMDLIASQPENTRYITNLSIKFKQIRKAKVITKGKKISQTRDTQLNKITEHNGEVKTELNQVTTNIAWYGGDTKSATQDILTKNNQYVSQANDVYATNVSNNTATVSYNVKQATRDTGGWRKVLNSAVGGEK